MQQISRIDAASLDKILSSTPFARSERMRRFLQLLVERTNQGTIERIKETEVGVLVFDREVGYDPKIDSIVRTEAIRLRRKLKEYYAGEGAGDPYRLHLPPGRYELEVGPNVRVEPLVPESPPALAKPSRLWSWAALAVVAILAAGLIWRAGFTPSPIPVTMPLTFFPGVENYPAFSPDGKSVAFTWDGENQRIPAVYIQNLESQSPLRITHSEQREYRPVWSPDGAEIAFLRATASGHLEVWKTPAKGGSESRIADLRVPSGNVPGLSWSSDGAWLASAELRPQDDFLRLVLIAPRSGEKKVYRDSQEKVSYLHPAFSPDGHRLAYVKSLDVGVNDVFVADISAGTERQVTFDHAPVYGLAWDPGGRDLIMSSQREGTRWSLWKMPLGRGKARRLTEGSAESIYPAVSPDGRLLVFSRRVEDINIWRRNAASLDMADAGQPWLASSGLNSSPQFSPDGSKVAFRSNRTGPSEIWVAENDGHLARQLTHVGGALTGSPHWSPDGKWLAFDSRMSGNSDIFIMGAGGGEVRRLTMGSGAGVVPAWSRDGEFVYYSSDRSGVWSVWRSPWKGGPAQLVRERAFAAVEGADGYLYYVRGPNSSGLFRAPVAGGTEEAVLPEFHAGMWGNWALGRRGLYFIDWAQVVHGEAWAQLRMSNGIVRKLFRIRQPVGWDGALSISPDEKWIAYASLDRSGSDLFLMRNWR
jgi:Tol biopolymer transport system component